MIFTNLFTLFILIRYYTSAKDITNKKGFLTKYMKNMYKIILLSTIKITNILWVISWTNTIKNDLVDHQNYTNTIYLNKHTNFTFNWF